MPASRARALTGASVVLLAAAARPIGLRDDADDLVLRREERVEGRHGERRRPEEDDLQPGATSPFAGARQLPDLAHDQVALDPAQPIDEQRAVEVIHLVLKRAREQARAFDLALRA